MNLVVFEGNLTRDVEVRYTQGENATAIARTGVALRRKFKNSDGNYEADFVNLVAFGKSAEFLNKYFKKGSGITGRGEIRTGSYTNKDGIKVYTTDIQVSEIEFPASKGGSDNAGANANTNTKAQDDSFMNIPEGVDELPFN